MIRVFYMPRTRSSRILWMLEEIGEPYDPVRIAREDRGSAEHLARHPLGRVPVVELDDGTFLFESGAICLQIADLYPDAGLIAPLGSDERGLAYQWVLFGVSELEGPLFRWIRELNDDPANTPSRERFAQAAVAAEAAIGAGPWLLGASLSVADVMCISILTGAHSRGLLEDWPGLRAYIERGEARPAYRRRRPCGLRREPRRLSGSALAGPESPAQSVEIGVAEAVREQPRRGASVALVNQFEDPLDRSGDRRVLLRVAAVELAAIQRRLDQARDDRLDALSAREIVGGDDLAPDAGRIQRERHDHPGPVLAGRAVHEHGTLGTRDGAYRADDRVGTHAQIAHVGAHDRRLLRRLVRVM
jgi:glutathione S-transferase